MNAKWYGMTPLMVFCIFTGVGAAAAQVRAEPESRGQLVAPSNNAPRRDAHGNLVISHPAYAPLGSNATAGVNGMNRDPRVVFATQAATKRYPICGKGVTDACVQNWGGGNEIPNCPGDPDCPQ